MRNIINKLCVLALWLLPMVALIPAVWAEETPPAQTVQPAEAAKPDAAPGDGEVLAGTVPAVADTSTSQLKVGLSPAEDSAVLRFPFAERMAMAVFKRGGILWIVLSKPLELNLVDFNEMPKTVIGKVEQQIANGVTVLRLPVDNGLYITITDEKDNPFQRAILLSNKHPGVDAMLSASVVTEPPSPPHVFVPAIETSGKVVLTDPLVGDEILVTPLYPVGQGVVRARDFVEFSVLATAQGVAVVKKADDVDVVQTLSGLRIGPARGAVLSLDLPAVVDAKSASGSLVAATFFPYDEWRPENTENPRPKLYKLFLQTLRARDVQEANLMRLRRAQIFLSEGFSVEAIGELDNIQRLDAAFFRSEKLAAMRGAARFLMYRFADAARDFAATELNNNKEIDYWRAMLSDLLGNPEQSYDYLAMNTDYISKYPPAFRQRLAIVAADRAVAAKEYNVALKIFEALQQDNVIEPIKPYVNFLMAKISSETGQEKEAVEMWDTLAEDFDHPFVRANAEYARVTWNLERNLLDREEAADRLERLRLFWRGDNLELNVLALLGAMYDDKKDYVNAMRIWNMGVTGFTNTAVAIEMSHKMQETFTLMFNEGTADTLSALDALALFYEYRTYMPSGTMGYDIIQKLADRLIAVDLLDQAAVLLDRQMRTQTEKEERSRMGAKLAEIYLANRQPQRALQVLQESMYGENTVPLRLLRNRLAAQAMADLGKYDKAIQTLGQDGSSDANTIRLDVYWKQKNWEQVITNVETILKNRSDITAPLTLQESQSLLKLALAYIFTNNTAQVQYLRDYFSPLMAANPNKPVFDFITSGDITPTTKNFDEVMQMLTNTRSFVDSYRARLALSAPKS